MAKKETLKTFIILFLVFLSINCFAIPNKNINFASWIEWSCKPLDKGKLTAFPHFSICQHKLINVSNMLKYEDLPKVNSERWLSLEDLEGEVWKDVPNYKGFYKISNYGRLYTFARNGLKEGKIVSLNMWGRYIRVCLRKNGERKYYSLHRLIAETFIENPFDLPQVDHINGNTTDNRTDNLRWVTAKDNCNNPITLARHNAAMLELKDNKQSKKVQQLTKNGEIINTFVSIKEAARQTKISKSNISAAAMNKKRWATDHWATVRTAGGFVWKFV